MQVWIGRNGERFGPYTDDEVRQWLRDGTCRPEELGWHEGMTDWRPLGELFPDERPAAGQRAADAAPARRRSWASTRWPNPSTRASGCASARGSSTT